MRSHFTPSRLAASSSKGSASCLAAARRSLASRAVSVRVAQAVWSFEVLSMSKIFDCASLTTLLNKVSER